MFFLWSRPPPSSPSGHSTAFGITGTPSVYFCWETGRQRGFPGPIACPRSLGMLGPSWPLCIRDCLDPSGLGRTKLHYANEENTYIVYEALVFIRYCGPVVTPTFIIFKPIKREYIHFMVNIYSLYWYIYQ